MFGNGCPFKEWIKARAGETSTWRGLITVLTALGVVLSPEQQESIISLGLALVGAINVFRKEK